MIFFLKRGRDIKVRGGQNSRFCFITSAKHGSLFGQYFKIKQETHINLEKRFINNKVNRINSKLEITMEMLTEDIHQIQETTNKFERKRLWQKIWKQLQNVEAIILREFWFDFHLTILRGLEDDGERSRETCALIIGHVLDHGNLDKLDQCQPHLLLPIMKKRMDKNSEKDYEVNF